MTHFLYRRGNGNEGNYPRMIIELGAKDNAYDALRVLVENDYIAGKKTRRHIRHNIQIDGEPEFSVQATVYEGPEGETEFGAAWITAELQPLKAEDLEYYRDNGTSESLLRKALDNSALRHYRQLLKN